MNGEIFDKEAFINAMCFLRQGILGFEIKKLEITRGFFTHGVGYTRTYRADKYISIQRREEPNNPINIDIKRVYIMGEQYTPSEEDKKWLNEVVNAIKFIVEDLPYFRKMAELYMPMATDLAFELIKRDLSYTKIHEKWKHLSSAGNNYHPEIYLWNIIFDICEHVANNRIDVSIDNFHRKMETQHIEHILDGSEPKTQTIEGRTWYRMFNDTLLFGIGYDRIIINYQGNSLGEYWINKDGFMGNFGRTFIKSIDKMQQIRKEQNVAALLGAVLA